MLRITGAILLMVSVGGLCLFHSEREEGRVRECEGFLLLVRHLSSQIGSYRTPIGEAIASFQNETLEEIGFLPLAKERGLCAALSAYEARLKLDEEAKRALFTLAADVGAPVLREAVFACDVCEGVLLRAYESCKSDAPVRKKTGRVLLVFFGLTALLVLG